MKRWPVNKAWFWEGSPFFRLLLPLMAGIIVYSYDEQLLSLNAVLVIIGCTILLLLGTLLRKQNSLTTGLSFLIVNTTIFFITWSLCYFNDIRNDKNWFGHRTANADAFTVRITNQPAEKGRTWKMSVAVINSITNGSTEPATGKAFIYAYKNDQALVFEEGDTVLVPNKWQHIKNVGNPFEFDYAGYAARNNIFHRQFVAADELILYSKGQEESTSWIRRLHLWCMAQLETHVRHKPTLGLLQAMLIGDEINLDADMRQAYSETGIIHIIAISGSHITIFFFLIAFLLGWIKNKKYHWLKYLVALPLIWIYVLMAGAPPSAIRSAIMFSILAVGFALEKDANTLNQLFATAFILLCAEPMWLYAVGFQLSFLAVLSLVLFYRPIYRILSPVHFVSKGLWGAIAASIAAEILVAPLVIYYFHLFPALFIVANVAAYLFMGIVLILGMLIIGLSFVPAIAAFIANVTTTLVNIFNKLVYLLQQWNPRSFRFLEMNSTELAILYITIAGIAVFLLKKKKAAIFVGLGACVLLMSLLCFDEWKACRQQKLVVYNISNTNHIELIDGKFHRVLRTNTAVSYRRKNYVLKPAHTRWHSWHGTMKPESHNTIFTGTDRILILDSPPKDTGSFPADYVIVNYKTNRPEPELIRKIFNPRKIVLGSGCTKKENIKWVEACGNIQMPLHSVMQKGSWVIASF